MEGGHEVAFFVRNKIWFSLFIEMLEQFLKYLLVLVLTWAVLNAYSQDTKARVDFIEFDNQQFGFDQPQHRKWKKNYEVFSLNDDVYHIPNKSVINGIEDTVLLTLSGDFSGKISLTLKIVDSIIGKIRMASGDTIAYKLPAKKNNYAVDVYHNEHRVGRINVFVYEWLTVPVVVIPMISQKIDPDSLNHKLNDIYAQAGIRFSVHVSPLFNPDPAENSELDNPSERHDRYTDQMIDIRDHYFEHHDPAGSYYIFVVDGFVDEDIGGYMVRNKGIGFVKYTADDLSKEIAHQLGFGIGALDDTWIDRGPKKGSTRNLMDESDGEKLTWAQWESIRFDAKTISYFDDYEDVRTNNGLIAYYLWEEDEHGNIKQTNNKLFNGIHRPFKRNQYGLHLDIDNFLFKPLFSIKHYDICLLHILVLLVLAILSVLFRKFLFKKLWKWIGTVRLFRFIVRTGNFTGFFILGFYSFLLINKGFLLFSVNEGKVNYLHLYNVQEAIKKTRTEKNQQLLSEQLMGSELLVKRGDDWFLEKRKRVLYFDVTQESNEKRNCHFKSDSDTLHVNSLGYKNLAESHYMVFNYMDSTGTLAYQKVYNHLGKEITNKLNLKDPAKRILLFVNGYRPTSIGRTFEENFTDVQSNGLEYPNSTNIIYDFDRYDYWGRWNQINQLFIKRLNPDEIFYADGHFSVATSNHGSLFKFSKLAAEYPDRCENKNHTCQTTTVSNWWLLGAPYEANTSDLLPEGSNQDGFDYRKTNGRIAGRNLRQMLNEIPNRSANDTLYIVAHSMGFAYAQGIIEKLKNEINLGGYYIISPENALSGKVDSKEWKEIWQYGGNYDLHKAVAPCLLDGIAPQRKVNGLPHSHRLFIPEEYYERMGFYDSHFIGHYRWIFEIPEKEGGYIKQR